MKRFLIFLLVFASAIYYSHAQKISEGHNVIPYPIKPGSIKELNIKFMPTMSDKSDEIEYRFILTNNTNKEIILSSFNFEIVNFDPKTNDKITKAKNFGDASFARPLEIILEANKISGNWEIGSSKYQLEESTDKIDLLNLKGNKSIKYTIPARGSEQISGSIIPTVKGVYTYRFVLCYSNRGDKWKELKTSNCILNTRFVTKEVEKEATGSDDSTIPIEESNKSEDTGLGPVPPLEAADTFVALLGIKQNLFINPKTNYSDTCIFSKMIFHESQRVNGKQMIEYLKVNKNNSGFTLWLSDKKTSHVVGFKTIENDRIYYSDPKYNSSFLEPDNNIAGIKAIKHDDGIFSITLKEFENVFEYVIEMRTNQKFTTTELEQIALARDDYYQMKNLNIDDYKELHNLEQYSDGITASLLTTSEWLMSSEYIPPKSDSKIPIQRIFNMLKMLDSNGYSIKNRIFSDRFVWANILKDVDKDNPDKILTRTMIAFKNNMDSSIISLYFFDGKNTIWGSLVDFKGSPTRIYFTSKENENKILSLGSELGVKIKKEHSCYSVSWKEYELIIGFIFSYNNI